MTRVERGFTGMLTLGMIGLAVLQGPGTGTAVNRARPQIHAINPETDHEIEALLTGRQK